MTKTIETLPETKDSLLCLKLRGSVTAEDFTRFFEAPLEKIIAKYGHYSLYLDYSPDFAGWEPEAAELSFKCIAACSPKLRRAAYINPPEGRILMMKLLDPLLTGEVRYFNEDHKNDALVWVSQD